MKKKLLSLLLSLVLLVTVTAGGTVAYLITKTEPITNSFVLGDFTYKLSLDANTPKTNGNVTMPTLSPNGQQTVAAGSATFTASGDPTLTGYKFGGWHYDEDGSVAYTDISEQNITVSYGDLYDRDLDASVIDILLHAKWVANTYEVIYNGNTASTGEMENSQHTYDVPSNLTKNTFEKIGYAFIGWNTDSDAKTALYADEAEVLNLTAADGGQVNLYAIWQQKNFKVSFDTQTDDVRNPEDKTVTFDEKYGTLPEISRIGYIFNGWSLDKAGENAITAESIVATAGDHTLYAQWTPITYTVAYDRNGDDDAGITGSTASSTHTYDVDKALTKNGYERIGYSFGGWNTKADGTGVNYADEASVKNLTATNGATVTLYAKWNPKSYYIRYHANGGQGSMPDQSILYGTMTKLNKNAFTKTDYTFAGWATTPDGEVVYNDEHNVISLKTEGVLDLYAVWIQDSHTVTFDYNGGYGSPASKPFQNGKAYGQLPEYPMHAPVKLNETESENYLFTGWYTQRNGGTRVYASTIANTTQDHTLYAHWEKAPSNNVIHNMKVYNNPDDDFDGVVDDVHLIFTCTSSFEKFNIPLKGLVPGQTYVLTYNAGNTASYGDYITGYQNSVYGSYIVATRELTGGRIDAANSTVTYYGKDLLSTWNDRIEPDGTNDGSHAATNDTKLQGPWNNRTITFTATQETMYWTWDFGLMQDNVEYEYSITDIQLKPVVPKIDFANKKLFLADGSAARVLNDNSSAYASKFTFDGESYAETMYYPISGLTVGTTYTITLDHKVTGALIDSSRYDYGCGIASTVPAKIGSKLDDLGVTWISNKKVFTNLNATESVTFTFIATDSTAYWVWNMANCSDTTNCTIDVKVTNFSAAHKNGGNITYHTATSAATS